MMQLQIYVDYYFRQIDRKRIGEFDRKIDRKVWRQKDRQIYGGVGM